MIIASGEDYSDEVVPTGFSLGEFDASSVLVVKVLSSSYDADFSLSFNEGANALVTEDVDLPDDFDGKLSVELARGGAVAAFIDGTASTDYTIQVISYDQAGRQIFP